MAGFDFSEIVFMINAASLHHEIKDKYTLVYAFLCVAKLYHAEKMSGCFWNMDHFIDTMDDSIKLHIDGTYIFFYLDAGTSFVKLLAREADRVLDGSKPRNTDPAPLFGDLIVIAKNKANPVEFEKLTSSVGAVTRNMLPGRKDLEYVREAVTVKYI